MAGERATTHKIKILSFQFGIIFFPWAFFGGDICCIEASNNICLAACIGIIFVFVQHSFDESETNKIEQKKQNIKTCRQSVAPMTMMLPVCICRVLFSLVSSFFANPNPSLSMVKWFPLAQQRCLQRFPVCSNDTFCSVCRHFYTISTRTERNQRNVFFRYPMSPMHRYKLDCYDNDRQKKHYEQRTKHT